MIAATREYREELPIGLIDPPALDARIARDEAQLEELGRDILKRGLIFPLAVVRVNGRFEIIDGYCRWLAAERAGLVVVPAFIYPTKEAALEGVKYAANAFRQDMSPAEEANFFDELMKRECGGDIEKVCALVNKSFNYVSNRLELFRGYPQVFEAVRAKKISLGVAAALNNTLPPEWINYYLDNAVRSGATTSVVVGWLAEWQQSIANVPQRPAAPTPAGVVAPSTMVDPNRCVICQKSDHAYAIRWVPIHTHCHLAILEPLLNQGQSSDGSPT